MTSLSSPTFIANAAFASGSSSGIPRRSTKPRSPPSFAVGHCENFFAAAAKSILPAAISARIAWSLTFAASRSAAGADRPMRTRTWLSRTSTRS